MNDLKSEPDKPTLLLKMEKICKRFPGVIANDNIDFQIYKSEIHALLGENGAGKSTLMKILYGYYKSDEGKIYYQSKETKIKSPSDAMMLNIGMVFQVLNLIPAMTVLENIALFLRELKFVYNKNELRNQIIALSKQYNLEVKPDQFVSQLSIGEQQKVEIIKLLLSNAKILILDEPTRVLAPHEIGGLFDVLLRLKRDGYAIVLITHKLNEVLENADRITVLRHGRVAGSILHADASENRLIQMMFEKELTTRIVRKDVVQTEKPVLELISFSTQAEGSSVSLKNLDLCIFPGEIVGVAGVSGNGQKELCDAILGMEKCVSGKKLLNSQDLTHSSTKMIRKLGMGFIPENPLTMATVPFMSVLENMAISRTEYYSKFGGFGMDWEMVRQDTQKSLEKFGFSFSYFIPAKALSGGNLQRLIIARELMKDPKLIVASYLTRGLDVQSTLIARQELMQSKNSGTGILLISEDLDELFALSDRLVVLFDGKIVGEFIPSETDIYQIGHLMTGSKETYDSKN